MNTYWATPGFDDWPVEKWHQVLKDLSKNGFSGIEPLICGPYKMKVKRIKDLLSQYGLSIFGFRTGGIAKEHNVFFNHADPLKRQEAITRFIDVIHYAAQFGQPHLLVGLIQGNLLAGHSLEEAESNIGAALHDCAAAAAEYKMQLDLEPVNRFEINHHNTIESERSLIKSIGCSNIRLLVDTFHMNIEEVDIGGSIEKAGDLIGHVHLADSNRAIPGKGHFDFTVFFKALKKVDYKGCMTIEALTDASQQEIEQTREFLANTRGFMEE